MADLIRSRRVYGRRKRCPHRRQAVQKHRQNLLPQRPVQRLVRIGWAFESDEVGIDIHHFAFVVSMALDNIGVASGDADHPVHSVRHLLKRQQPLRR